MSEKLDYAEFRKQLEDWNPLLELAAVRGHKKLEIDHKGFYRVSFLDAEDQEFSFKTKSLKNAVSAYNTIPESSDKNYLMLKVH